MTLFSKLRELAETARKPFTHSCALCSIFSCSKAEELKEWEMAKSMLPVFEVLDLYEGTLALILAEEAMAVDADNKPDYQSEIDWKRLSVKEALKRAKEIAGK